MKNWDEDFWLYLGLISAFPLMILGIGIAVFLVKTLFDLSGIPT